MNLIILSISFGVIGYFFGGFLTFLIHSTSSFYIYCFSIVGFFSPALYMINSIYKRSNTTTEIKKTSD